MSRVKWIGWFDILIWLNWANICAGVYVLLILMLMVDDFFKWISFSVENVAFHLNMRKNEFEWGLFFLLLTPLIACGVRTDSFQPHYAASSIAENKKKKQNTEWTNERASEWVKKRNRQKTQKSLECFEKFGLYANNSRTMPYRRCCFAQKLQWLLSIVKIHLLLLMCESVGSAWIYFQHEIHLSIYLYQCINVYLDLSHYHVARIFLVTIQNK